MKHYLLIKREGFAADGAALTASQCAERLLNSGIWPLWDRTRNRAVIAAGDALAIYLAGDGGSRVVATAIVERVEPWSPTHRAAYPLMLDGTPVAVLRLSYVATLRYPVLVAQRLGRLSFIRRQTNKWGSAFMGGTRALSPEDYTALTAQGG